MESDFNKLWVLHSEADLLDSELLKSLSRGQNNSINKKANHLAGAVTDFYIEPVITSRNEKLSGSLEKDNLIKQQASDVTATVA